MIVLDIVMTVFIISMGAIGTYFLVGEMLDKFEKRRILSGMLNLVAVYFIVHIVVGLVESFIGVYL